MTKTFSFEDATQHAARVGHHFAFGTAQQYGVGPDQLKGPAGKSFSVLGLASPGFLATVVKLRDMVGEFEKPKFFTYKQNICAHSRNETVGCNACIDICSAEAISSEKHLKQIKVNPNLCIGCGACTTVCPTGALTYTYPRASEQGVRLKTLISTYAKAAGGATAP